MRMMPALRPSTALQCSPIICSDSARPPELFSKNALSSPVWALFVAGSLAGAFDTAASTWTNDVNGNASGQWSVPFNWSAGIPDTAGAIADFSKLDITVNSTVSLDAPQAVGTLLFGNNPAANGVSWAVDGPSGNLLTLDAGKSVPTIGVTNVQALLGGIEGANGFVVTGNGALAIYSSAYGNSVTGPIFVKGGLLGTVTGAAFAGITGDIFVAAGATFAADDDFDGTILANNFYLSGAGGTPSGYANSPTTPDGTIYFGEPVPMGALDIAYNATLSGNITLSADATISHGYNSASINGPIAVTNAGQNLVFAITTSNQAPLTVNGAITLGTGALTITGVADAAPVILNGSDTYAGGTIINGGTLQMGASTPNAIDTNGGLTINGGGTLDLYGNSMTFPFLTGASGTITDTSQAGGQTVLTIAQAKSTAFGGSINDGPADTLALILQGSGALTLGGTNDYSGPTTVSSGELIGGSGGDCTNSAVEVADGATNGFLALVPAGQWSCASLTYDAGTNYLSFDFGSFTVGTNNPPPIVVASNLTINGTVRVLLTNGIWLSIGTYPLLNYRGLLSGTLPTDLLSLPSGVKATLTNDPSQNLLSLSVTQIPAIVLAAPTNGFWTNDVGGNISGSWGAKSNWKKGVIAGGSGATANFSTLALTVNSIVNNNAPRAIGTLLLANNPAANGVTLTLDGGLTNHLTLASSVGAPVISVSNLQALVGGLSGTQGFVMEGNGALAIYGSTDGNNVKGPIYVNSGLLATVDGAGFQGITGNVTVAAGAGFSANGGLDDATLMNNFYVSGNGAVPSGWVGNASTPDGTYLTEPSFGALDLLGNVTLGGTITLNTNVVITHGYDNAAITGPIVAAGVGQNLQLVTTVNGQPDLTIFGSISLGQGVLTVNGIGAQGVTLNAANTMAGTVLNSGMLHLGNISALGGAALTVGGGLLDLNMQSISVSSLNGASGTVITDNGGSGAPTTLTVNYNPVPCTPAQTGGGSGGFVQPTPTLYAGAIDDGVADAVGLTLQGCGALVLSGANNYSGPTTVTSGELVGSTSGSCSNSAVEVADNAANGVEIAAAGGQWTCAGLTYDAGAENLIFNFGGVAPSTAIAPLLVNGNLSFNGAVAITITIANINSWPSGSYPLIAYTGTLSNLPSSVTFSQPLPQAGTITGALTNNADAGTIFLDVTSSGGTSPPVNTNRPTILPIYASAKGTLTLQVASVTNLTYILESAPALGGTIVWTPISTNAGTGGIITFTVPVSTTLNEQFFRLLVLGGSGGQPPPTLSPKILPVYQSGTTNLGLQLVTVANHNYILESSPGLEGTNVWTPVSTNAGTGGTITPTVPLNRAAHEQFFRFLVQ
jgi:fibronectin-binding autotransporter adhesin